LTDLTSSGKLGTMPKSVFSKVTTLLIVLSTLTFTAYPVFAETSSNTTTGSLRQNATNEALIKRKITQERVEAKKDKIEEKISDFKEKMASREATLKAKLEAFKDQRKAQIAKRISDNLNKINESRTISMQRHLDAMSVILAKLETRVNQQTPDIKDPAAAKAAISNARATIATASATVQLQTQKDYTVQITSEAKVRADVKLQRDKLHADLLALRKTIIDSKKSVSQAIRIAKTGSISEDKEGTPSGQR